MHQNGHHINKTNKQTKLHISYRHRSENEEICVPVKEYRFYPIKNEEMKKN